MNKANTNHHKNLRQLAKSAALELGNIKLTMAERSLAAQRLRPLISAMILGDAGERERCPACLCPIIVEITKAIIALLELGEGYRFADVKVKLDIAHDLMGALNELASSDAIAIEDKVPLIKAAETLINPALRTAVRLVDPDRVEFNYVDDAAIGIGSSALSIAWRASAIVTDKGRELRQSRITLH